MLKQNIMYKPDDAQVLLDGSYYKIGVHGKPFIYLNGEWILSQKQASEIPEEIKRQAEEVKNPIKKRRNRREALGGKKGRPSQTK